MSGILGGLQSMHTDGYDEVFTTPTEGPAKIAIATQNILKHEAGLCNVIDPLGGSYYVETLTDQMEAEILRVISDIDEQGGMFKAVESGYVQGMIGESALAFQEAVDTGEQIVVGVNSYQDKDDDTAQPAVERPETDWMQGQIDQLAAYKSGRNQETVAAALQTLRDAARSESDNTFGALVDATRAAATQSEIIAVLRDELGFGQPLVVA